MKIAIKRRSEVVAGGLIANGGSGDELDTFHVQFDPDTESVVEIIVETVATIHNVAHEELDPLAEFIDPEALQALLESADEGGLERIEFCYEGLAITVLSDGWVQLRWK